MPFLNLKAFFKKRSQVDSPEVVRAKALIRSVDRGGLPTDPILVNRIARALGLEVASSDPMALTLEKIRRHLKLPASQNIDH